MFKSILHPCKNIIKNPLKSNLFTKIPNPNGYNASDHQIFSNHITQKKLHNKNLTPFTSIDVNNDLGYIEQVVVHFPENTLVGVEILFTPISTIGLLDISLMPKLLHRYALYNEQIYNLSSKCFIGYTDLKISKKRIFTDDPKNQSLYPPFG